MDSVSTRWIIRRDLPEVVAVEAATFVNPMSETDLRVALSPVDIIGFVAECCDSILGHVIYQIKTRHLIVHRFAVAPSVRRKRVGTKLLLRVVHHMYRTQRNHIIIPTHDSALTAHLFLQSLGFTAIAVRDDKYIFSLARERCVPCSTST